MRDIDVRQALRSALSDRHRLDLSCRIIEELGLCENEARIDVAVVNGSLNGFEIKSPKDTLERLPHQATVYSRVFDSVTIVTASSHLSEVLAVLPEWWGVMVVFGEIGNVGLEQYRPAQPNPQLDLFSLAQLLWREEAIVALEQLGAARGVRSKPRHFAWQRLAEVADRTTLSYMVRETIKNRADWRAQQ